MKPQPVIKLIKYQTVKTRHYKDDTANSVVSDVVTLNVHQTCNLNIVELLLNISSSQNQSTLLSCNCSRQYELIYCDFFLLWLLFCDELAPCWCW